MKVYIVTTKSNHTGISTIEGVYLRLGAAIDRVQRIESMLADAGELRRFEVTWTEEEVIE